MVKQKFIAKNTSEKAIAILRVADKVFELKPNETIKFEALPNEQIIYPAGIIEVKIEEDKKETKKEEPAKKVAKAEPQEQKVEEQKEAEKVEEPKKTTKRGRRAKKWN